MPARRAQHVAVAITVVIALVVGLAAPAPADVLGGTWTSPGLDLDLPGPETGCTSHWDDLALDPVTGSPGVFDLSGSFLTTGQVGSPPSGPWLRIQVHFADADLAFTPLTLTPPTYAVATVSPGASVAFSVSAIVDEETCEEDLVCSGYGTMASTAGSYAGGVLELTMSTVGTGIWAVSLFCDQPYRSLWSGQSMSFTGLQLQV